MSHRELDLRPHVYYIEGDDSVRSTVAIELTNLGVDVGLIAMSLAHVVQQIEAGHVREFRPHVAIVGEAFVDGHGSQVQPIFRRSGLALPSIAYTTKPVFWHHTFGFCQSPNIPLLKQKIDQVIAHAPAPSQTRRRS